MSTAHRIIALLIVLPLALLMLGVFFWYLAYGAEPSPPDERAVSGLEQSVTITWQPENIAHIQATSLHDFYRGMGYAHGAKNGWPAVLWRQTGLGQLGHWFDEPALSLDTLTRTIGISTAARQAFDQLDEDEQATLQAYADGMNAALSNREVQRSAHFVLLDHDPEPWEPWHSLVVERLFAWLAAPELEVQSAVERPAAIDSFLSANDRLREWLHVDGFEHSTAWTLQDTTGSVFYQRHSTGRSVQPLYMEIAWKRNGERTLGATLPGFPAFLSGRSEGEVWTILPRTSIAIQEEPYMAADLSTRYERLETAAGDEYLLPVEEGESGRALLAPPPREEPHVSSDEDTLAVDETVDLPEEPETEPPVDSTWFVQWDGFDAASDLSAFQAFHTGDTPSFSLLTGDGARMTVDGNWSIVGDPLFVDTFDGGFLIGQDPWSPFRAEHLREIADLDGQIILPNLVDHDSSTWAAEEATIYLASLDSLEARLGQSYEDGNAPFNQAVTYLRNWEFDYSRASISATIFDRWVREYWRGTGAIFVRLEDDEETRYFDDFQRLASLQRAVDELTEEFGDDLQEWRWERTASERRYFPTWHSESIRSGGLLTRTRYAPLELAARGHTSSISWGPTLTSEKSTPPVSWEFWVRTADWQQPHVRRRYIDVHAILGRYRHRENRPDPVMLQDLSADYPTTTLLPNDS